MIIHANVWSFCPFESGTQVFRFLVLEPTEELLRKAASLSCSEEADPRLDVRRYSREGEDL
jgi:hypothetical protein